MSGAGPLRDRAAHLDTGAIHGRFDADAAGAAVDDGIGKRWIRRLSSTVPTNHWILVVLAIGFSVRFAWLLYARPAPVSDFGEYLRSAHTLLDHGRFGYPEPNAYRLPLLPIVLAGLMLVSERVAWLSLWSVFLSTAICWLVYLLALRLRMLRRTAICAALICALLPNNVVLRPGVGVGAPPGRARACGRAHRLERVAPRPWVRFLVAGLLIGGATLTRGDGLVYGAVVLVFGLVTLRSTRPSEQTSDRWRPVVVRTTGAFVLGVLVVITPWAIRNELVVGRGTLLGGRSAIAFFYADNPNPGFREYWDQRLSGLSEAEQQREAWRISFEYIWNHPFSLISTTWRNMRDVFSPNLQGYGIYWSTRLNLEGYPTKPSLTGAYRVGRSLSTAGAWFITIVPILGFVNPAAVGRRMLRLVVAIVVANWAFYCVLFLGVSRYRFLPDAFLCLATAAVIEIIWAARPAADAMA